MSLQLFTVFQIPDQNRQINENLQGYLFIIFMIWHEKATFKLENKSNQVNNKLTMLNNTHGRPKETS